MKFKKCGPEHEASYLFEVDKNWMRSGNDFSELLESIRKEAYLKGFRRGQEEASYGFWNKDCRKKFREDEETDKIIEHEHFWTAHDEWAQYIGKTASNLAASAYRSYADGENAIDGVIETLSVMLRTEFENTKQKEDAECIGAALPVTQVEKWLSDTEMPDGYAGFIFPRTSMAVKGLVCELPPVDSGYRVSNQAQSLFKGARIGQLVITPIVIADFVTDLGTERGTGSFGSTGE